MSTLPVDAVIAYGAPQMKISSPSGDFDSPGRSRRAMPAAFCPDFRQTENVHPV
jgi:hypothetical protein